MDLQYLANVSEITGSVVVILSLVYVAVQIRQNTQAQRMENYSRGLDRLAAIQSMLSQDSEMSLLFSKGVLDSSKLTPQERVRFTWAIYEALGAFEFMFHASKNHAIPEEVWTRWSAGVAYWLTFPGGSGILADLSRLPNLLASKAHTVFGEFYGVRRFFA
jgi:hypothetical protein